MDEKNQVSDTESESEESFEELLNQSIGKTVRLTPGEKVEAVIATITPKWVFIDLGGKSEGFIGIDEFTDDHGTVTIQEGDTISAYFLSSRNNEMLFTTRLTGGTARNEHLEEAYHNRIPVEGFVEKEVKGGFEVKIAGSVRAFCPFAQMGLQRVDNADEYIGRHMTFRIIEYGERGRNIILSNRAILEEDRRKQKEALRESLKAGMQVRGKITSIRKFGAFVTIGGIEGLIPISEISWGRVDDIDSMLSVGQTVDVVIKKLDWENDKFSFSLKDVLADPWSTAGAKYPEGSGHKGTVSRLATFGAFVTLEPGIDGLLHISELGKGKRIQHPREVLEINQAIEVRILKIDEPGKRLSLALVSDEQDSEEMDYKKYLVPSGRKSSGSFGTLGDILRAKMKK
ncbi:MAG: 30S ribosomal protein S1 [Deltaproteobacteria bacterium]|nr:30S ribosomal protein S1 [Deltaproteobacteria bacterium]